MPLGNKKNGRLVSKGVTQRPSVAWTVGILWICNPILQSSVLEVNT